MTDAPRDAKTRRRRFRLLLNDALAFVRSVEVNRALQGIGWEELMNEQIQRNGESSTSAEKQYNPYSHDPLGTPVSGEVAPKVESYGPAGNYVSGTNEANPTKFDRILALEAEIEGAVLNIMNTDPEFMADPQERADEDASAPLPEELTDDELVNRWRSEGMTDAQIEEALLAERGQ